jgi:hypothetical protein
MAQEKAWLFSRGQWDEVEAVFPDVDSWKESQKLMGYEEAAEWGNSNALCTIRVHQQSRKKDAIRARYPYMILLDWRIDVRVLFAADFPSLLQLLNQLVPAHQFDLSSQFLQDIYEGLHKQRD